MLCLAFGLASCANDSQNDITPDPQPQQPTTLTFKAAISDISRVHYWEENGGMKLDWDDNDQVTLYDTEGTKVAVFKVINANEPGPAVMQCDLTACKLDDHFLHSGCQNFTGTLVYEPKDYIYEQWEKNGANHLKYGNKLTAQVKDYNFLKGEEVLIFENEPKTLFKVMLKSPEYFEDGATLKISGASWNEDPVLPIYFNYEANKGENLTLYLLAPGDATIKDGDILTFTLNIYWGGTYVYEAPVTADITYESGKMYTADITEMQYRSKEYNGHAYVDLGLPSGTLWATCNVGAPSPKDTGTYYTWYNANGATANWGSGWTMPTQAQWQELCQECTWEWATLKHGVNVMLVTGTNGNSICLPAAGYIDQDNSMDFLDIKGYYWSSTTYESNDNSSAYYMDFDSEGNYQVNWSSRYFEYPVRPVLLDD